MRSPPEPFADPATSKEKIFRATYLAHVDHGYAELSIQQIADRASLSKSTLYHHFDGKDDLLLSFTEALFEWYIETLLFAPSGDPVENLDRSLDLVFLGETSNGLTLDEVRPPGIDRVYLSLRAQAAQNPEFRDYFDVMDETARERIETLVESAIEDGSFREVDPQPVAAALLVFTEGAIVFRTTHSDPRWLRFAREMIDGYLQGLKRSA